MHVPELSTERLTLRGHTLDDVKESTAMWGDPEVTRHIGGRPQSAEEVWGRVCRYAGHWSLMGFGYFVVREKASGRFVGEVGAADFRRDIEPSLGGAPEVGWALASWAQGQGFATESVRAVLSWADAHLTTAPRTVCMIDDANLRSIRVAEKCGFRESFRARYRGEPAIVYARDRPSSSTTSG